MIIAVYMSDRYRFCFALLYSSSSFFFSSYESANWLKVGWWVLREEAVGIPSSVLAMAQNLSLRMGKESPEVLSMG